MLEIRSLDQCRGLGIDGFYRFEGGHCQDGGGLRLLLQWGLLEVLGIEVIEEKVG